jgi:hypothetical protein
MYSVSLSPAHSLASVFGLGSKFENFFKSRLALLLHSGFERHPSLNCRHPSFQDAIDVNLSCKTASTLTTKEIRREERGERREH